MFIVNKYGTIHTVVDNFQLGKDFRKATEKEIAAWYKAQELISPESKEAQNDDKVINDSVDQPGAIANKRHRRS